MSDTTLAEPVVAALPMNLEAEQALLFTRFFRSSSAQERAIQGTGLGLSIVQSIVHSHGGEITIRSRHHVGTEVRVGLPLLVRGSRP